MFSPRRRRNWSSIPISPISLDQDGGFQASPGEMPGVLVYEGCFAGSEESGDDENLHGASG